jgi:hypothetical protein
LFLLDDPLSPRDRRTNWAGEIAQIQTWRKIVLYTVLTSNYQDCPDTQTSLRDPIFSGPRHRRLCVFSGGPLVGLLTNCAIHPPPKKKKIQLACVIRATGTFVPSCVYRLYCSANTIHTSCARIYAPSPCSYLKADIHKCEEQNLGYVCISPDSVLHYTMSDPYWSITNRNSWNWNSTQVCSLSIVFVLIVS